MLEVAVDVVVLTVLGMLPVLLPGPDAVPGWVPGFACPVPEFGKLSWAPLPLEAALPVTRSPRQAGEWEDPAPLQTTGLLEGGVDVSREAVVGC